jgi:hypothetical protein
MSYGSGWRRDAPLGEGPVAEFEAEHAIRLPEPYRTFVVSIANGAQGPPSSGLVGLGEPASIGQPAHTVVPGGLRRPFPLVDTWV